MTIDDMRTEARFLRERVVHFNAAAEAWRSHCYILRLGNPPRLPRRLATRQKLGDALLTLISAADGTAARHAGQADDWDRRIAEAEATPCPPGDDR